jgi:hypothetical protein
MASVQEFAAKIKAKYPQYQDMPDSVLAERMLAKFPQYKDMVEQAAPTPPEKPGLTLASAAFPGASKERTPQQGIPLMGYGPPREVSPTEQRIVSGMGDALSLPTRAAGTVGGLLGYQGATGGKRGLEALADSETGLLRPARQAAGGLVKSGLEGGEDGRRGLLDYGKVAAGGLGYVVASAVEDPTVLAGGAAKLAPKAMGAMTRKAVLPVTKTAQATKEGAAKGLGAVSERLIRRDYMPLKGHEKAGWNPKAAMKHGLYGKDAAGLSEAGSAKLSELYKQQKALIQEGKAAGGRVDFSQAIDDVLAQIEKGGDSELWDKAPALAQEYKRRIARIRDMDQADPNALREAMSKDVADAQLIKSDIGEDAAFASMKGVPGIDKDAAVRGRFAALLYGNTKTQIEKNSPEGLREINNAMSEIIPLRNAAEHRAAVEGRQRVGKLTDFILGGGAMVEPSVGLPALALKKLVDSPRFTKVAVELQKVAQRMAAARSPQEATFYANRLKSMGVTAAELQALTGAAEIAPNAIPFRKVAENDKNPQPLARK